MRIHLICLSLILLAACAAPPPSGPDLPEDLQGWWRLTEKGMVDNSMAPELLRTLGLKSTLRVVYEGHPRFETIFYEMSGSGTAFEAVQKWRPQDNTIVFHKSKYFIVVRTQGAPAKDVNNYVRALESVLQ